MDVIWNLTRACPWDCAICCVFGYHVCNTTERLVYSEAKEKGEELTLAEKLTVLKILADRGFEIDFSGGDPLYYDEDFQVVEQATRWLPSRKIGVSMKWELLRFYPVGRGIKLAELTPSNSEYLKTMKFLRGLHGFTKIFFQHSLRILEGAIKCPAVVDSIGILPDGTVTACAWAIDDNCRPYPEFRLGKLPEDDLDEILENALKIPEYCKRTNFCRAIAHVQKVTKGGKVI